MEYNREITDMVMIQYIILYTMASAERVMTHSQLSDLILENCNINYADFLIALDNLCQIDCVRVFNSGDVQYCELLPKGVESSEFFSGSIPIYIKEPIKKSIAPFFKEEELKKSVRAELTPINENEYFADCGIYEGNTPLMQLSVYAGSRKMAADMLRKFKKDPESFYRMIMSALSEDIGDNKD